MLNLPETVTLQDEIQGVVKLYIALWGDENTRDSYETWFDKSQPPEMGLDFLPIPLLYEHAQDGVIRKEIIGKVYQVWFDNIGIPALAQLDKGGMFFSDIAQDIRSKKLATSSASAEHLVDFDKQGRFVKWLLAEVSLTEHPAESRMPKVAIIRNTHEQRRDANEWGNAIFNLQYPNEKIKIGVERQMSLQELLASLPADATLEDLFALLMANGVTMEDLQSAIGMMEAPAPEERSNEAVPASGQVPTPPAPPVAPDPKQAFIMALQKIMMQKQQTQGEVARNAQLRTMQTENMQLKARLATINTQQSAPPPQNNTRFVAPINSFDIKDRRFAHLSPEDLTFGYALLRSKERPVSQDYMRHMVGKFAEQKLNINAWHDPNDYHALRSAFPYSPSVRADELMQTDVDAQGQDWVYAFQATQLWEHIRLNTIVDAVLSRGVMVIEVTTGNLWDVPTEEDDPLWYTAIEQSSVNGTTLEPLPSVDESHVGTDTRQGTLGMLKTRILITDELIEDSLIPILPQVRKQLETSGQDVFEALLINGDIDATNAANINLIDGNPTDPAIGAAAPYYLAQDGWLKPALLTSGKNRSASGSLTEDDYLDTVALLPNAIVGNMMESVVFVTDVRTNLRSKKLSILKTRDVSNNPTIEGRPVDSIWGVPVYTSGQMQLAQSADGKVHSTTNTTGRILCIVPKYWALGWKRRLLIETERDIDKGVTKIVGSMRVGIKNRSTSASSVTYNVGV